MKKIIYTLLLIGCVVSIQAQDIVLKGTKALSLNKEAYFPTFGKSNNEILISGPNYKGLSLYNEIKNSLVEISDKEGAGYKPQCDEYGIITYQTTIIKKGRKQQKHYQYNPDNGISSLINEPNKKIIKTSGQQIIINYNGSQKK